MTTSFDQNTAMNVVIGLLDGNVRTGRLAKFDPTISDLAVDLDRFGRTFLPAEHIAYIGFSRLPNESRTPTPTTPNTKTEKLKIHVAGGQTFAVEAVATTTTSNLGFRAYPTDASSSFKHIYFYAHGVNAKEKDVPLGEMLLESGILGPQTLREGIAAQSANRATQIGQILVEQGTVDAAAVEQAAMLQARKKLRIGQILVEAGLASQSAIDRALVEQKQRKGKRLGEVLVEMGVVTERDLAITLGKKFQIAVVDLDQYENEKKIHPAAVAQTPRDIIEKFGVLPVKLTSESVTVAISDPLAIDAIDALRFHFKRRIDEILVTPTQLRRYVDEVLARSQPKSEQSGVHEFNELLRDLEAEGAGAETTDDDDEGKSGNAREATIGGGSGATNSNSKEADGGVVRLLNQVIIDACRRGASDIHVEPNGKDASVAIRFRIDGECVPYQDIPGAYRNQLIARIKIMSGLDISERRKPQDGKIRFRSGGSGGGSNSNNTITELRVATVPTVNGNEDAVLRILAGSKPVPLDKMGLTERNLSELQRVIRQPYGLILCVGPTGSGKTTTLHSALGSINTPDTKIWTAEDPVEITQPGLRQVQVNAKIGLTFASCMRSFLRADPDVIMVGEMRDQETASTAIEASLTGHLVLSTLHTNSAPETITRLLDMGLDPFSFADSLLAVLAQRLTRALCKKCKTHVDGTDTDFAELTRAYDEEALETTFGVTRNNLRVWRAVGCDLCSGSGYKGRLALHELLVTDDEMKQSISRRAPVDKIRTAGMAGGMTTLLQDGVAKAIAGATDMKQVLAVCTK